MKKIYILLVTLLTVASPSFSQTTVEKLIAYFPFDGNARDVSGNGYHATVRGATLTTDRFNRPNSAYSFDGQNDNIIIPSSFDLLPKTISFWFNAATIDAFSRVLYVSDNPALNYGITAIEVKTLDDVPKLITHITSSRDTATITSDAWFFFTITINTDSTHFYMNGEKLKSRVRTGYPKSNTGVPQTFVGSHRQGDTPSLYFHGKIDDVKIYNKEMTKQEVKAAYDMLSIDLGPDFCLRTGQVRSLSAPGFTSYRWSTGSSEPVLRVNQPGKYTLTATDQYGNRYFDEIQVSDCPQPDFTYTFDCKTNSFRFEPILNFPYDRFHWKLDNLVIPNNTSPTHQFSREGQQYVTLNVYQDGEEFAVTKTLDYTKSVTPYLGRDTILCTDKAFTLTPDVLPGTTLRWSNGTTGSSLNVTAGGTYWVEATRGDCTFRDEVKIEFSNPFSIHLGQDTTLCEGSSVLFDPKAPMDATVKWSDGSSGPTLQVNKAGTYWVEVQRGACTERDEVLVTYCTIDLFIPNIFTPNADGLNDSFFVRGLLSESANNGTEWELTVFNRWGGQVYHNRNYKNDWDGGKLKEGSYFYLLANKDQKKNYKGYVEILR
ncbi:gliding motility-associated C-terminal domain-containing protein [Rufibacter sediminis]|uniref:Gliding motility-associated C-terminal domain-containing protein n=1 Tax=Rufibacter sediminis TaxID=2762756 RepID=A0ABR6VLK9_9BACT|nr:gliding motility-associated C-terminal domain-containing protein [Rufibacter sediminis]MBC3538139.1 gliding motility-associated C-terminal domain-containing protein [Rufibacter sediminis]